MPVFVHNGIAGALGSVPGRNRRPDVTLPIRQFIALLLALILLSTAGTGTAAEKRGAIRIGVTPVFLDDQTAFLEEWRKYLEARLDRRVEFTQRSSYREIMELLLGSELEFAWICGFPFVQHRDDLRLLAVPIYRGEPLYQSYLIVPRSDQETRSIAQLRNKLFAYSDPDSNSGFLVPQYLLLSRGEDRKSFFRKTFFTWAHQKVVEAVAAGLADGGAVDGYVWDTLQKVNPELTGKTRVVEKSEKFGFPPFVASRKVAGHKFTELQEVLIAMTRDAEGRRLLGQLNIDGFNIETEDLFESIAAMATVVTAR